MSRLLEKALGVCYAMMLHNFLSLCNDILNKKGDENVEKKKEESKITLVEQ